VAASRQTRSISLCCESAGRLLPATSTIAICYYSLLSLKADAHFTVPWRVEGWVDLGTAVGVCSPCPRLCVAVVVTINTIPAVRFKPGSSHTAVDVSSLDHCDLHNLPKVVTRQRRGRELNSRPSSRKSSALTTRLPSHLPCLDTGNRKAIRIPAFNNLFQLSPTVCFVGSWANSESVQRRILSKQKLCILHSVYLLSVVECNLQCHPLCVIN